MKKVLLSLLVAGAIGGVPGWAQSAQGRYAVKQANSPGYPLQITSVSAQISQDGIEFDGAKVTLKSTGKVPCDAFSIGFIITFSDGQTRRPSFQVDFAGLGYTTPGPGPNARIMPGQTYVADATGRIRVRAPQPAVILGVEARLDYIKMEDGKTYGPDPGHIREQFRYMRWGTMMERERLLDIYKTKGIQMLLGELQRK